MGFFRDLVRRLLGSPAAGPTPAPSDPDPAPGPAAPTPDDRGRPVVGPGLAAFLPAPRDDPPGADDPRAWRSDRIPTALDERAARVDRAMVLGGFLTPEALAEIRRVADAVDRARSTGADRARVSTEERREAATERRRARAEGVAHRRSTEILYLGRGVSKFLGDHRGNLEALEAAGLPVLGTPGELAGALGVSVPRLRWLAFHAEAATRVHYASFEVPKKSGGVRTLSAPHRTLATAQRWILGRIVGTLPVGPEAHGFVAGRSILTNASAHSGRSVVVNLDLQEFFPSIGYRRVRGVFRRLGYSPSVSTVLALLCTECPRQTVAYDGTTYHVATGPRGLPQGACTSPGLSNQVARRLDRRLAGLASKLGASYTRYADDLTFSGDAPLDGRVGYLMARVRHLAGAEGFVVNESKSRVLRRNAAQVVTGLVVNDRPGVARDEVRRLRAILHRARSEGLDAQDRDGRPDFRAWLRGKIAYVGMARPEVGARLLAEFEGLDRGGEGDGST